MIKKKKTVVTPAPTTAEIMKSAMTHLETEINSFNSQKEGALSVFRSTATRLQAINCGLEKSMHNLEEMISFATAQKEAAEKSIADNNKVREKILAIIGE